MKNLYRRKSVGFFFKKKFIWWLLLELSDFKRNGFMITSIQIWYGKNGIKSIILDGKYSTSTWRIMSKESIPRVKHSWVCDWKIKLNVYQLLHGISYSITAVPFSKWLVLQKVDPRVYELKAYYVCKPGNTKMWIYNR